MSTPIPPVSGSLSLGNLANHSVSVGINTNSLIQGNLDVSSSNVIRGKLSPDSLPDNTMVIMDDGTLGVSRNGKLLRIDQIEEYKDEFVVLPSFFPENANLTVCFHSVRHEEDETTVLYRIDEKHHKLVYYGSWIMLFLLSLWCRRERSSGSSLTT